MVSGRLPVERVALDLEGFRRGRLNPIGNDMHRIRKIP